VQAVNESAKTSATVDNDTRKCDIRFTVVPLFGR